MYITLNSQNIYLTSEVTKYAINLLDIENLFLFIFKIQWILDLSFFNGMEKQNDECEKTINPGNYYTL